MSNDFQDDSLVFEFEDFVEPDDFEDPAPSLDFSVFEDCPDPDGYSDEDYQELLRGF